MAIMEAEVSTDPSELMLGAVTPLFWSRSSLEVGLRYTITPDGSRSIANVLPDSTGASTNTVVLGWGAAVAD